jgi:hypothetical protein
MSFYYDDYPIDDHPSSNHQICPNCSGTDFYSDPVSGTLTCSSCYTQSQSATQEEFDYDDAIGLIAKAGAKHRRFNPNAGGTSNGRSRGRVARPIMEYDRSKTLPDAKSCCLAFQWLLWDASKCVSKLAGIHEESCNINGYHDNENNRCPSLMEQTVEKIWFTYLQNWMKSTQEFSAVYPEMRVSFRDYFLTSKRKVCVLKHLSITVGKKIEEDILKEMQMKYEEKSVQGYEKDDESISSTESGGGEIHRHKKNDEDSTATSIRKRKNNRPQILTVQKLSRLLRPDYPAQHPNGIYNIHPHHAVLRVPPSLTLILSILQLALTHLQTGVAPHHLTSWAANGQLPHVLNGYSLLPTSLRNDVQMAQLFFCRSYIPPATAVEEMTYMLAAATSWFDTSPANDGPAGGYTSLRIDRLHSNELQYRTSLHNVPLLTARIIQDLGFDQGVLDISLALMGVSTDSCRQLSHLTESSNSTVDLNERNRCKNLPTPLQCAHFNNLYTPLHIAAVIVVACKLSPGWEMWQFTNLHKGADMSNLDVEQQPSPASVPWNEAQLQLLGNGRTLNHYLNFLESTAFRGVEPTEDVTHFFRHLEQGMTTQRSVNACASSSKPLVPQKILPNVILSGASNPNEPKRSSIPDSSSTSPYAQYQMANNIGRYTAYQFEKKYMDKRKFGRRVANGFRVRARGLLPYHPFYCRMVEYVCYIIEEPDPDKLHYLVEELEVELLMTNKPQEGVNRNQTQGKAKLGVGVK